MNNHMNGLWEFFIKKMRRPLLHLLFWTLITTLSYLTYRRVGGDYVWIFVVKEMVVAITLFYIVSWLIAKGVQVRNFYLVAAFYFVGYLWWVSATYWVCDIVEREFEREDRRFDTYLALVLNGGYFKLFTFAKTVELVLDYLFVVTISVGPKLIKSYVEQSNENVRLERDNLIIELNFLKSQVSQHFLFNCLNSIYRMVTTRDPRAAETVLQLSGLMRYMLYDAKDEQLLLQKETGFIGDYVALERIRYDESVRIDLAIQPIDEPFAIFPLLLIPFVENAFKHGPARSRKNAWVRIELTIDDGVLHFHVGNGVNRTVSKEGVGGVGNENVKKRLMLHYPNRHTLRIEESETEYHVYLTIQL